MQQTLAAIQWGGLYPPIELKWGILVNISYNKMKQGDCTAPFCSEVTIPNSSIKDINTILSGLLCVI